MPDDHHLITDGATIAYQLSGPPNTVPVGYGHGVLMSRQIVRGLGIFDIDAIADRRRLITYDQRGHGASRGRPKPEDYRFEQAADDLLRVLDAAGLDEPIDFAGSSLGAGCGTARRPQRSSPLQAAGVGDPSRRLGNWPPSTAPVVLRHR
ncbi:alpha/beta fold hydrolase [Mycolicibacterium tokaiense]|jgi:pimeloyl-ACP methyl ester carboxylesterase|uniref:alpha/beta fold hydrolase n=1 Tax=Mycolicibacterium tokaiense TaxID=39695 RepID=UPI001F399D8A|nr:alpha/beta fold hydrolase [Mycolicibacterium tokaiense]